jgi:subtilisin family serine protease
MRSIAPVPAVLLVLAVAACTDGPSAPHALPARVALAREAGAIAGDYIVVLRGTGGADVDAKVRDKVVRHGGVLRATYRHALAGYAATLDARQLAAVAADPDVAYVEQDRVVSLAAVQGAATWALDRIDQRALPLSTTFAYAATGAGVTAYIVDTGIDTAHVQFGGRARNVYDGLGGDGQDCNGHGTHVAGLVGSDSYGVAKGIRLRGLRVLGCTGSGATSGVVAALDWLLANLEKPAVANLSVTTNGVSTTLNLAVDRLATAGVFVAVAAGNANADACTTSPASAATVTAVAASTSADARASYSNWGNCVDLYAPGSGVVSTWMGGGTRSMSGTSMAAPHVAGVAALYKATYGDTTSDAIRTWLRNRATAKAISGNVTGTPNKLLYKGGL